MPTYQVRCRTRMTSRPYVLAVEAPDFDEAVKLAALRHELDPIEVPKISAIDPAEKAFKTAGKWFLLACAMLIIADIAVRMLVSWNEHRGH